MVLRSHREARVGRARARHFPHSSSVPLAEHPETIFFSFVFARILYFGRHCEVALEQRCRRAQNPRASSCSGPPLMEFYPINMRLCVSSARGHTAQCAKSGAPSASSCLPCCRHARPSRPSIAWAQIYFFNPRFWLHPRARNRQTGVLYAMKKMADVFQSTLEVRTPRRSALKHGPAKRLPLTAGRCGSQATRLLREIRLLRHLQARLPAPQPPKLAASRLTRRAAAAGWAPQHEFIVAICVSAPSAPPALRAAPVQSRGAPAAAARRRRRASCRASSLWPRRTSAGHPAADGPVRVQRHLPHLRAHVHGPVPGYPLAAAAVRGTHPVLHVPGGFFFRMRVVRPFRPSPARRVRPPPLRAAPHPPSRGTRSCWPGWRTRTRRGFCTGT